MTSPSRLLLPGVSEGVLGEPQRLIVDDTVFCNEWGSIRLNQVHGFFGCEHIETGRFVKKKGEIQYDRFGRPKKIKKLVQTRCLSDIDISQLVHLYTSWRDLDEVVPIKFVYRDNAIRLFDSEQAASQFVSFIYDKFGTLYYQHKNSVTVPTEICEWFFPNSCKRGNPVYLELVHNRFKPILEREPKVFFNDIWGIRETPMLYITVTTDPSTVGADRGWLGFGDRWNKFITNLRQQFGTAVYVRTWQSQQNGLPHAHALVYFCDHEFSVVWWDKDGTWRLPSRDEDRSAIKAAWKWGHCDIVCVQDTQQSFKDLLKYVLRDLGGGESDLTNAMVWFYRRQSFSVSEGFAEAVWGEGCIDLAEPGDADSINPNMCNSNFELLRIEIYPMIRRDLLSFAQQTTLFNWTDPPPMSECDVVLLEHLVSECQVVECARSKTFGVPVFMYRRV